MTHTADLQAPVDRIAMLGLGTMGVGMASQLAAAGLEVTAWNRTPHAWTWPLRPAPRVMPTLGQAIERAQVVLVCVSNDAAVRAVVGEIADAVRAGDARPELVVDTSTTSVELTLALAAQLGQLGVEFVDMPLTGSKLGAAAGTMTVMLGASQAARARLTPVLDAVSSHVVHAGPVGQGQAIKQCLNAAQAVTLHAFWEGMALAVAQGVSTDAWIDLMEHSALRSGVAAFKGPRLLSGDREVHFKLGLMGKDVGLALQRAEQLGVDLSLVRAVQVQYARCIEQGLSDEDFMMTSAIFGELAGGSGAEGSDSTAVASR